MPETSTQPSGSTVFDDASIADLLMEGKRVLPSQGVRSVVEVAPRFAAEFSEIGARLGKQIESARQTLSPIDKLSQAAKIDGFLDYTERFATDLRAIISTLSDAPKSSPGRHRSVGELLLPFAVAFWSEFPPQDNGAVILDLHEKSYGRGNFGGPEWLAPIIPFLMIAQLGSDLPSSEVFIRASRSLAPKLKAINDEIGACDKKIANIERNMAETKEDREHEKLALDLSEARAARTRAEQRIGPLYEQLADVRVTDVPEVFSSLDIRVCLKDDLVSKKLVQAARALERTICLAVLAAEDMRVESKPPCIHAVVPSKGEILLRAVELSPEDIASLGKSPERLTRAVRTLCALRELIFTSVSESTSVPDLGGINLDYAKDILQEPMTRVRKGDRDVISALLEHSDPGVAAASAELLKTPIFQTDATAPMALLEQPSSFELLAAVTSQYLHAPDPLIPQYRELLHSQRALADHEGLIERCRANFKAGEMGDLAELLDKHLESDGPEVSDEQALVRLALLRALSMDELAAKELRYQIPNLSFAKEFGKRLSAADPESSDMFAENVRAVMCIFSQSLRDYYSADKSGRLKEAVEMYRFYLAHPELLKGIPANHALKNAIGIFGPPGVGKSFFAQCLENELDRVRLVVLSPGEKELDEDLLAYTKRVINEVIESEEPTLLLIDEAETTVFDRMNPLATSDDRKHTNFLLQAVDKLRKNHPRIFLLIASNYPDRVDEAMIRHGRIDLIVYLEAPGREEREQIIRATLKKENFAIPITKSQLAELVDISDGFIPIQIIQAITEIQRLLVPYSRYKGKEFKPDFEFLRGRFEQMRIDQERREAKLQVMKRDTDRGPLRVEEPQTPEAPQ